MNIQNTSVLKDENTPLDSGEQKVMTDAERKEHNRSHARARIAERKSRENKTTDEVVESELEDSEEELIAKSRVGKRTQSLEERIGKIEERADADEVAKEVEKFVKNHEYSEHIDTNKITTMALSPAYAELDYEDIVWLSLKDQMSEILEEKRKKSEQKIDRTALPKSIGGSDETSVRDMSLADFRKNQAKIIARLKSQK